MRRSLFIFIFITVILFSCSSCSIQKLEVINGSTNYSEMDRNDAGMASTDGKNVYFSTVPFGLNIKSDYYGIYRTKIDGSSAVQIVKDSSAYNIITRDNLIYFLSTEENGSYLDTFLYCMNTDGSNKRMIKKFEFIQIQTMYLSDDNIFYFLVSRAFRNKNNINSEFTEKNLYKMKIDGAECSKLTNLLVRDFILCDRNIFAIGLSTYSILYRIDVSDGNYQKILKDNYTNKKTKLSTSGDF